MFFALQPRRPAGADEGGAAVCICHPPGVIRAFVIRRRDERDSEPRELDSIDADHGLVPEPSRRFVRLMPEVERLGGGRERADDAAARSR